MMTINLALRRFLIGCLSSAFMLLLVTAAFGAQDEKVIISYSSRDFSILPAHVALIKGFFKEEGIDPLMVQMRPPVAAPALMNGEIHYTTTFGSMLNAIMQGMPAKLLAVVNEKPPYYIVARPGIKSVTELRGKKIAAQQRGLSDPCCRRSDSRIQRDRSQRCSVRHDQRRLAGADERADRRVRGRRLPAPSRTCAARKRRLPHHCRPRRCEDR